MENDIVVGISQKLDETFGSACAVYTDDVKQELESPCFSIINLTSSQELVRNNRYFKTHRIDIQYFPQSETSKETECRDVKDTLFMAMEYITVSGSLIRATKMSAEISDNVLHFFVDYDVFVFREVESVPKMQTLRQSQYLKVGE